MQQRRGGGLYGEMDATYNGWEGGGNSRCRERGEEALMESRIIQSFSSPNNSNRLFICWQIRSAAEAIITVHGVM